ncbi:pyrimidine 5'-nucleotidase [Sphingobium boeckii]|uniref:Putative hydrolase of the HAD superfamily n=1 Tax=Sphingobium boeckii TaxID=1082345 RepID=A0A7W9AF06_9SPHN|nr:pyrimidine 5'-nucleotidase [Sphingobium boeckii]MBB5684211.1 putative hydrolase of the HAD superfamily [Sphingobium boeckii]
MIDALAHIRNWIFDLDNTLYPPGANLFALIDEKMGAYIADLLTLDAVAARKVQKDYFRHHGTTLAGLMAEHGVDPHHFLDFVHDIPLDRLSPDLEMIARIERLPGRRIVFTNGDASYAARVLEALGLHGLFDTIYDIHRLDYRPKPLEAGYARMCEVLEIDPAESLFVEDMARNLVPAKRIGMATVWINNGSELGTEGVQSDMIDYEAAELGAWLRLIQEKEEA